MKKFLAIFLIALFVFQISICQETEEENELIPEEELEIPEEEVGVEENGEEEVGLEETGEEEVGVEENDEEWQVLDVDDLEANDERPKNYAFGLQFVIADKIGNHAISNALWTAFALHDLSSREKDGFLDEKFNVTFYDINNPDDTFLAEFIIRSSFSIPRRVLSYISYQPVSLLDDDGNTVDRLIKETHQYNNASFVSQIVNPGTFEPVSDPALVSPWTEEVQELWLNDELLRSWGQKATEAAIQKALDSDTISTGSWRANYYFPSYQEYSGKTWYLFKFTIVDDANFLVARGNSFVTKDEEDNFEILTSGIESLELESA